MPNFMVRDLMINVTDSRLKLKGGGYGLCTMDQPTLDVCTIYSPVMYVARMSDLIRVAAKRAVSERGAAEKLDDVAIAIGRAALAGALQGGAGGAGMPNPNCGGTSWETIPTPITPVVITGGPLTVADLPALKKSLHDAISTIEQVEARFAPKGAEVEVVAEHLDAARGGFRKG